MKKIYLLISACFILFCSTSYAVTKVDLGVSGSVGKMFGFTDPSADPANSMKLNALPISFSLNIDFINVMSWSKPYYGMGFGFGVGLGLYDQWFGNLKMSNNQTTNFGSADVRGGYNKSLVQIMQLMQLEVTLMYKFYPTRELSLGIGPVVGVILSQGSPDFLKSDVYSNATEPIASYYLTPVAATITAALLIDVTVTKFWGNWGLYFGANLRVPFLPFALSIEGKGGLKYRFNI